MTYENWKVSKADYQESEELQEEYSKVAEWCNNSQKYQIQEVEDEYCVVKIPEPLPPTAEEVQQARARAYEAEVDPLMSEYTRKKTFNLFEGNEEAELLAKIEAKVAEIKEANPYPATTEPVKDNNSTVVELSETSEDVVELYSMEI